MSKKSKSKGPSDAADCSSSSDADHACNCFDKLASECRLNPTAYQRDGKERVRKMESELSRYREALDRIARPLWWMQRDAKREGYKINGAMAANLADSGSYLSGIAKKALSKKNATAHLRAQMKRP